LREWISEATEKRLVGGLAEIRDFKEFILFTSWKRNTNRSYVETWFLPYEIT